MAPIHDAARDADVETLRRLLAEGVSPDATDNEERTPLHLLCEYTNKDYNASSPLVRTEQRYQYDRLDCFKLLRDAGANLEAITKWDDTPLHCTACSGSVGLLSLLVQSGVNVDAITTNDSTALHVAVRKREIDCVEVLLAAGADIDARSTSGGRPFDIALSPLYGDRRLWPLFLRAGAEIPTDNTHAQFRDPYIVRVRNAGGWKKYEQAHLARITSILAPTPRLPPEMVRKIVEFWLHAGFY